MNKFISENQLNENALEAGQKDNAIADSITYLSNELRKLFPEKDWTIQVEPAKDRGDGVSLHFSYNSPTAQKVVNGNSRNIATFMGFLMILVDDFGNEEALPKVSWEQIITDIYSVKFRKISSKKSVQDVNQKLVAWFQKNREAIYAQEGLSVN